MFIWKKHPIYDIEVSNFGTVRSSITKKEAPYNKRIKGMQAKFSHKQKLKQKMVHSLVLETFFDKDANLFDVIHIDNDIYNNRLDNILYKKRVRRYRIENKAPKKIKNKKRMDKKFITEMLKKEKEYLQTII